MSGRVEEGFAGGGGGGQLRVTTGERGILQY
jgi:hypothetical protein